MTLDEKIAAFKRGECPGCGAPLLRAVVGFRHFVPEAIVNTKHEAPPSATKLMYRRYQMAGGEPAESIPLKDARVCRFNSDRLFTIQILAGKRDGKSMLRDEDYGQPSPRTPTP